MTSFGTVNEKDIGADGRFRRKYELDDGPESRTGTKFAAGLLIANAFIAIKQIFFSSDAEATDEKSANRQTPEDAGSGVSAEKAPRVPTLKLVENDEPAKDRDGSLDDFKLSGVGSQSSRFDRDGASETGVTNSGSHAAQGSGSSIGSNVIAFPTQLAAPAVVQSAAPPPPIASSGSSAGGGRARRSDDRPDDDRTEPNRLPVTGGPVVLNSLYVNQSVVIGMSSLLQGTHDPDGDQLFIPDLTASSGELIKLSDTSWKFTADLHDVSEVTFHYHIADAEGSVAQTALLDLLPIPGADFTGTEFADLIIGTAGRDRVEAKDGDDDIITREGDDVVIAGDGDDRIVAGSGDDTINAGAGNDVVFAGAGDDLVFGGDGDDLLAGEEGNDNLLGEAGDDIILAGAGDDAAFGDIGNDVVRGGAGADLIDGGAGDDDLSGGDDDDVVIGGEGDDVIDGDAGDDVIVATSFDGDDVVDGGDGIDTYNLASTSAAAVIDLENEQATSADIGNDSITNVENVTSGSGDDVIVGDSAANRLLGNGGDDDIDAGDGDDTIVATAFDGDDDIDGGDGTDTYDISRTTADASIDLKTEQASGEEIGNDAIADIENVIGGQGDDVIVGSDEANVLTGNGGDDMIRGCGGDDVVVATAFDGDDDVDGGDGTDTYDLSGTSEDAVIDLSLGLASSAEIGNDTISNFENAVGGQGDDVIVANGEANQLVGNDGNDVFVFLEGSKSGKGGHVRDRIEDFEVGDTIDVSGMDGNLEEDGWQRLVFNFSQATFFEHVGQAIYRYEDHENNISTLIQFNFDDDDDDEDEVDYEIEIIGRHELDESNIVT